MDGGHSGLPDEKTMPIGSFDYFPKSNRRAM
jgi:hypothetical protein